MNHSKNLRPILIFLLAAALTRPAILRAAEPAPTDAAKLAGVLGSDVAAWKLTGGAPVWGSQAGRTTLGSTPAQAVILESASVQPAPVELTASFWLHPPTNGSGYAYIQIQMAYGPLPDKTVQALNVTVAGPAKQSYASYNLSLQGPQKPPAPTAGTLYLQSVTDRSLAWPEEVRAAIDAEIAATPKLDETLFTVRCTVEKDRFRCWVLGRYAGEIELPPGTHPEGLARIVLPHGAELAALEARPLKAVSRRFEPLSIAGNLNSSELAGQKLNRATLPSGSVDGVPFEFPQPSQTGNDHIDVSRSWTRFGALSGWFAANSYMFGGRWVSADHLDPVRICQYIPPGRYQALHLIAVADGRQDSVPIITAQFYRPDAGHPVNFEGTVPTLRGRAGDARVVPVKLANGRTIRLYHVVIPLDPDAFSWFTDLPRIGLEITKQVEYYRAYPDPCEYSWHGAGLPSSVQIYAMTLERAGVDLDIQPDQFGHVWTAPTQPGYTMELRNGTGGATTAKLIVATRSDDGQDTTRQEKQVALPADGTPLKIAVKLQPKLYGLHTMTVTLIAGHEIATYRRDFAYLHPDTRAHDTWVEGHGPLFGGWWWGGGHSTPPLAKELEVMGMAGAESGIGNYSQSPADVRAVAENYHFISEAAFGGASMYVSGYCAPVGGAPKFDPTNREAGVQTILKVLKGMEYQPGPISQPTYIPFFAEPQVGPVTMGIWPSHWGVDYHLTKEEQATFDDMKAKFLTAAPAIHKEWPNVKLLLPYGDPMNTVVFLKLCPEARPYIDGAALDLPAFERLPEQQVHQVVLNRLYPILQDIHEYKKDPWFVLIEGFCIGSTDIDTGQKGQAEIGIRDFLNLLGYGIDRFESAPAGFDCANYWGENHYGAGWCTRLPVAMPKLGYIGYATITRHLNRANFAKYLPTGSTSVYCQQYRHSQTGKLIHVLWTIRGKRPVTVNVPAGATLDLYDFQDNVTKLTEKNGTVTFTIGTLPVYLEGLTADARITLGESEHSDSLPAADHQKLSNLGNGSWKLVAKEDAEYAHNKPLQIERFLGKMTARKVDAPKPQGGEALAIHLEKQDVDRGVMPFYTTLEPSRPIAIPGKASHLGLWVHAASDWGRVVYVLRDAKGEKWISVGTKEEWNNDDVHCWSSFCFDGWRYLRFELPSSAPYDCFREYGTTWWGSYGGDGVVDLPLKIEKIIVERRPKVIYGNALVPAKPDDVWLGDLDAEYARAADRRAEAVRLSRLRMPLPKGAPALANPIADLTKTGVGPATRVLKVTDPLREYDGTRCHVHFDPVAGAKSYDIWVSAYPDGRGAMKLGAGWTESGGLITGLHPDIEFYAFVTYTDQDGKLSKPSAPLKFQLKDRFGYK